MTSYSALAGRYDDLTGDVPYPELASFYEELLKSRGGSPREILDLGCGTGALTLILAERGYGMIGVDSSAEMLAAAARRAGERDFPVAPMFLCQSAEELDLYGTVDGAVCCLDVLNYIRPEELGEVFRRLCLFIAPGGVLAFDILSPERLRSMDGEISVDEGEYFLCVWRAEFDGDENALIYSLDLFESEGGLWRRNTEEHVEYAHGTEHIMRLAGEAGFENVSLHEGGPEAGGGRIYISAVRKR